MESWAEHTRFALGLLALITPLPVVPIFLGLTTHLTPGERNLSATVAGMTLLVVLVAGYYVGEPLITALGSSIASFQIAGGIIIALSGFSMLNNPSGSSTSVEAGSETPHSAVSIGIVPIGIPLLGGPGALTAVMLEGHSAFSITHDEIVLAIILGCSAVTWVALLGAAAISRVLGATGISIFQRVFGVVVISIGVEVFIRGLGAHVDKFAGTL